MTTNQVFLHGISLANYRGIGNEPIYAAPFDRFNFFIGANNAGKSSLLHYICNHLKQLVCTSAHVRTAAPKPALSQLDVHIGAKTPVRLGVAISRVALHTQILKRFPIDENLNRRAMLEATVDFALSTLEKNGQIWLMRSDVRSGFVPFENEINYEQIISETPHNVRWEILWNAFTQQPGGNARNHWVPDSIQKILASIEVELPDIALIPAIREISAKGRQFLRLDGDGLIEELARLQNPGVHEPELEEKFQAINRFVQSVTKNRSATIEIPHDLEHVLVRMDGRRLPLESLGTGIHEVVMLAAFCTLRSNQIVCIEEPEIHLHPLLQRRLVQYLNEHTDNQYFIATHSASLIDTPDAAVFHVKSEEGQTKVSLAQSSKHKFDVCRDLGYKASDLLQANSVIWVEGPSDRIYIRNWLESLAPDLREGIDYSIMFYGGRLLSHLSVDEPESTAADIDALISVRRLNRNLAVVIDSDKDGDNAPINATKQRVQAELKTHGGMGWITAGREIENYVEEEAMTAALRACYPSQFAKRLKTGRYDHALPFKREDGTTKDDPDKVKVAKELCRSPLSLDVFDLRERLNELVELIRRSNP